MKLIRAGIFYTNHPSRHDLLDRPGLAPRPLSFKQCQMRQVIVYIDGFNLYHAIDALRKPWLKWLDVVALSNSLLRNGESLKAVKYFSAFATWMPVQFERHRAYVDAIVSRGAIAHMGQFKEKPRRCRSCGARWIGHEEKETDVQIAVHMIADAMRDEVDRLIVISADTDLVPAVKMIAVTRPDCEVFVAAPPGRFKNCRALQPKLELTHGRLAKALLPDVINLANGRAVDRPPSYAPPALIT